MTERQRYVFRVCEYVDGTPWIMTDPWDGSLSILQDGFLGFDLTKGTTLAEAEQIADRLNDVMENIVYTSLKD